MIFDLDGTLIDSAPDLLAALNHVLVREGCRAIALADIRPLIGDGAMRLLERGLAARGIDPAPEARDAMVERFLAYYEANIAVHTLAFPGVPETLESLQDSGLLLAVCTNKLQRFAEKVLEELGLSRFFDAVVGGDGARKPDPAHLRAAVEKAGAAVDNAVMVGDSVTDVESARACAMPVVAVTYGYSREPVSELGADAVIDRFDALPEALSRLLTDEARPSPP